MTAQPHLTSLIVVIVIGAGALHAVWNAIAKHVGDRVVVFALMGVPLTLAGALAVAVAGLPARAAVAFAIASAVIHVGYDLALMNSYRLGSLNQVYPIARGTSPWSWRPAPTSLRTSGSVRYRWPGWRFSRWA